MESPPPFDNAMMEGPPPFSNAMMGESSEMGRSSERNNKIETFNDLSSLYSLNSNITNCSIMESLPGMDYGDNFHEYK